jgi:hypothetical protein
MDKLAERLKSILTVIEETNIKWEYKGEDGHIELTEQLKSIIEAVEESKCSNGLFCGLDKKW